MGERTIEGAGHIVFEDLTNNFKAVIIFSTYKKSGFWKKTESGKRDEFVGMIYHCDPIHNPDATARIHYSKNSADINDLKSLKDVIKPICDI